MPQFSSKPAALQRMLLQIKRFSLVHAHALKQGKAQLLLNHLCDYPMDRVKKLVLGKTDAAVYFDVIALSILVIWRMSLLSTSLSRRN